MDLTERGVRSVRPGGVSLEDFAEQYVNLMGVDHKYPNRRERLGYLAQELAAAEYGPTLFVFDNFETMTSQVEAFRWIDDRVRGPNKVLITSREHRFNGDFGLAVLGMTDSEAAELIIQTRERLRINQAIDVQSVMQESGGHPYIIKLLLGELAKGNSERPERIIAGQDEALEALFQRTYSRLSPIAKRVFLTLCSWRSSVPDLVLEAVLMDSLTRENEERIQLDEIVEETVLSSFVEQKFDSHHEISELSVPLAARLFGLKKLDASEHRIAVERDRELLQMLGAQPDKATIDFWRRIERFFDSIAIGLDKEVMTIEAIRPVAEYVASGFPYAWVLLSQLYDEFGGDTSLDKQEDCLLKFVEGPGSNHFPEVEAWHRISRIRQSQGNYWGELDALAQVCRQKESGRFEVSNAANGINRILKDHAYGLDWSLKQRIVADVVGRLEEYRLDMDATDYSRLAWLYKHLGEHEKALQAAQDGLSLEQHNYHCQNFITKFSGMS